MTEQRTAPTYRVLTGDCVEVMAAMPEASVDAIVTDPPYLLAFMGRHWDHAPSPREGQAMHEAWATEALRVLKPGGHLLAFGGTRTAHRLVCAIEDAGFEIRDTIAWMYGSGFPKSLDVSKAIDRAAGAEREAGEPGRYAARRPQAETQAVNAYHDGVGDAGSALVTAPATPAAEQWEGWGTALKPAHEPIVVARKPLGMPALNVLQMVECALRERGVTGEIEWTKRPASDAAQHGQQPSSSLTAPPSMGAASVNRAGAFGTASDGPPSATDSGPSTPLGGEPTESTSAPTPGESVRSCETPCSPRTEAPAPAAVRGSESSSPSTTSTEAAPPTASQSTARSTSSSSGTASPPDTESFAGIATGLTGSLAVVHIKRLSSGAFEWPDGLPQSVAARGLTVAANVLAYGTGALNIDGCRVGMSDQDRGVVDTRSGAGRGTNQCAHAGRDEGERFLSAPAGRWPANVVLDAEAGAILDAQTGVTKDGVTVNRNREPGTMNSWLGTRASQPGADMGCASRFFYCAKADSTQRQAGLGGDGGLFADPDAPDRNDHPTVKPIALMRWLVRLVTPPGGLVLDPFTGSGTTGIACALEGLCFQGIERDGDYARIARARIAHWSLQATEFAA